MSTPLATAPALRVGVIGTGWGVKVQVPMFREAGLQVVALYSRDEKRLERLRKEMDVPHGFTDVGALCECEEVDIVSLVCPTHLRKDFTLKAIHAGKHVLAEKPMALNAAEAQEMLEAANQGLLPLGKRHFMDFELRCAPPVMRARELVLSGTIGAVKFISVNTMMDFSYCQLNATHGHWNLREMGGGVWSGTGTHFADLARHILGREVARVSCVQSPMVEQLRDADGLMQRCTAENFVSAHLEMEGDAPPPVHILVNGHTNGLPPQSTMTVVGESGTLSICFIKGSLQVWRRGAEEAEETVECGGSMWAAVGTPQLGVALRRCLLTGVEPGEEVKYKDWPPPDPRILATFEDGVAVQRVTDAVHASAAQGGNWLPVSDF